MTADVPAVRKFVKNALHESKLRMSAPTVKGGTRRPTLSVETYLNNPRIVVWTGVETDTDKGRITAALDALTFTDFLNRLGNVIDGESKGFVFKNFTGPYADKKLATKLMVGRESDESTGHKDEIFIAVLGMNITAVKFYFSVSEYHVVTDIDGNELDALERSNGAARAWMRWFSKFVPMVLATTYVEPEPFDPSKAKGNYSKGNYNKPNSSAPVPTATVVALDDGGPDFGGAADGGAEWNNGDGFPF